jgi:hypothetical protein
MMTTTSWQMINIITKIVQQIVGFAINDLQNGSVQTYGEGLE